MAFLNSVFQRADTFIQRIGEVVAPVEGPAQELQIAIRKHDWPTTQRLLQDLSAEREATLRLLGQQLPALDMGEEVSLALASLATQSANDMLGGLLTIPEGFANQRRGSIRAQMEPNLPQTLAYVYRDLTDAQLNAYADWSETDSGQAFFRASSAAARDALNP